MVVVRALSFGARGAPRADQRFECAARAGDHFVVADLAGYPVAAGAWSGIVALFVHLPQPLRREVHARAVAGLRPGGVVILEAYTPAQVHFRTGGPVQQPELLMRLADLQQEFAGLEFLAARELEREVIEGSGHRGRAAVVQVIGRRPATHS